MKLGIPQLEPDFRGKGWGRYQVAAPCELLLPVLSLTPRSSPTFVFCINAIKI